MHSDQDGIEDLKLKTRDVSGGFTVPPRYFDRMRTHVLNHTNNTDENIGGVPEGYFERSRSAILHQTIGIQAPKTIRLWYQTPGYRYVAAAVVIMGLSLIFWMPKQSATIANAATISETEILQYLEKDDLRDITIYEASFTSVTPSNAEVEQYIINQSDEEHLLLEQL
jgi:hypothetical protein